VYIYRDLCRIDIRKQFALVSTFIFIIVIFADMLP